MTGSIEKTPKQLSIENGEQIIITIMAIFVLFEVFTLILKIMNEQVITVFDVSRITLTIISCIYLYKGKSWAKYFLTFGAFFGGLTEIRFMFILIENRPFSILNFIFLLVFAILQLVIAYYLIFSSDVDEYFKSCKA